jgi:site-specific DNA-methyltransferase (adenine-specific)
MTEAPAAWLDAGLALFGQDMLDVLGTLAPDSIDACLTDPPYGLAEHPRKRTEQALAAWLGGDRLHVPDGRGFMGRKWDTFVPPPGAWDAVYRVLKPGAWLLAFAAPRTQDLMGLSIRLAGFEIQDSIEWWFGQGFPKARSRLKPAHEPVIVAWKPAPRVPPFPGLEACKVGTTRDTPASLSTRPNDGQTYGKFKGGVPQDLNPDTGRWPTDLVLTHSPGCVLAGLVRVRANGSCSGNEPSSVTDAVYAARERVAWQAHGNGDGTETVLAWECEPGCPVAGLDAQSGTLASGSRKRGQYRGMGYHGGDAREYPEVNGDTGGASRFFPQLNWADGEMPFRYQAKAPKSERPAVDGITPHVAVKPLNLMRWLARLVTPEGGLLADPFAGTGTTLAAARLEGFRSIGCENDPDACTLARKRLGLGEFAGVAVLA